MYLDGLSLCLGGAGVEIGSGSVADSWQPFPSDCGENLIGDNRAFEQSIASVLFLVDSFVEGVAISSWLSVSPSPDSELLKVVLKDEELDDPSSQACLESRCWPS